MEWQLEQLSNASKQSTPALEGDTSATGIESVHNKAEEGGNASVPGPLNLACSEFDDGWSVRSSDHRSLSELDPVPDMDMN